jgi:hypothetical protein
LRWNSHLCRRKNDFYAAHTHTRSRAVDVSPPWAGKIASAYTPAIRRQTADGVCADCRCIRVYRRHGGLTPPALALERASLPAKNDYYAAHTHTRSRAAGVSPPWQPNAHATATGFRGWITFRSADSAPRTTAGLRQPLLLENADAVGDMRFVPSSTLLIARLAYASRSWCTTFVGCNMRDLRPGDAHATKSGGRQPAVGRRTERCAANITHCSPTTRRTNKSGGRQPAVATKRTRNCDRLSRMDHVSCRRFGSPHHGWLTPAAPT